MTPSIRLSPMAGVTDWPFRLLCFEQGCDVAYTEMVSAMGYLCAKPTNQAVQNLIVRAPGEGKLYAQIFGKEPELMVEAAQRLVALERFDGIDINMGCPAHKIAASGEGCGLMRTSLLAAEIMERVRQGVHLPVTVKMRLGWDDTSVNVLEIAHIAQESGMDAITVHGRTRMQHYSGKADWEMIARVKQSVTIPVYANGDVFTPQDGVAILKATGCDGVLVGRGAMGNPWLFGQVKKALNGESYTLPTLEERVNLALRHTRMLVDWKGEPYAIKEMRKHASWYLSGMRGAAQMRVMANQALTYDEMAYALTYCLTAAKERAIKYPENG